MLKKAHFTTGGVEHAFTRILQPLFNWPDRAVYTHLFWFLDELRRILYQSSQGMSHEGVIVTLSHFTFFSHSQPYVKFNGLKVTLRTA